MGKKKKPKQAKPSSSLPASATIIPRKDHCITRADISNNALKVLERLNNAGFAAYLVGGGVRDLLLRHAPKDFDVATDAHPEQIKKLFRNCRLIGRRFRLAHIHFGREIIEVATFRSTELSATGHKRSEHGMILRDNVYGTIAEDAIRRDFTVNSLYYSVADLSVVDLTHGMTDLKNKTITLIGDPVTRYQEDPVRMLRAIRFAAKLDFNIDTDTEKPLFELHDLLDLIAPARLFDEILKLFHSGKAFKTYQLLHHYGLFEKLFPYTAACYEVQNEEFPVTQLLEFTFKNTDARIQQGKPVTPAFLLAALLWYPLQQRAATLREEGLPPLPALEKAMGEIIYEQSTHTAIPKRFRRIIREIWLLQYRLPRRYGRRPFRLLDHPRFRAGYDFLLLRAQAGETSSELGDWWTRFQSSDYEVQQSMVAKTQQQYRKNER